MTGTAGGVTREPLSAANRGEWGELAARTGAPSFLGPGYLDVWARHHPPGGAVDLLAARRDGRLVAALPVLRGVRTGPPGNRETPLQGLVAESPGDAGRLAAALMRGPAPVVEFCCVAREDPSHGVVSRAAAEARRTMIAAPAVTIPIVDTHGGWEAYWAGRSRNLRKNVGRVTRRAEERGDLAHQVIGDARGERLDALLDEGFAVEGSGWKDREGTSLEADRRLGAYYRDLARWAADAGELRLFFIRLDGRAIAFGLCVLTAGGLYAFKIGYDEALAQLSPGVLLIHRMVRWTFEHGVDRFDFAGHDAPYKATWATGHLHQERLTAFSRAPRGRGALLARRARSLAGAVVRRVRSRMR